MSTRLASAMVHALIGAFVSSRSWRQAALAKRLGVAAPGLARVMQELQALGLPLEVIGEQPDVTWSLPEDWSPRDLSFTSEELPYVVDALLRTPPSQVQRGLLRRTLSGKDSKSTPPVEGSEELQQSPVDNALRALLLEAHAKRIPIRVRYASTAHAEGARTLSIQQLKLGPPLRFVAYCHRSQGLRLIRGETLLAAGLRPGEEFVAAPEEELQQFSRRASSESSEREAAVELAFTVRYPEARWVRDSLLPGMVMDQAGSTDDAMRVVTYGGAPVVARFVAGLGGVARAEGETLKTLVREIAAGALSEH